jgi:hypothetical protein
MPLEKSASRAAIGRNIAEMSKNHPHDQAVAAKKRGRADGGPVSDDPNAPQVNVGPPPSTSDPAAAEDFSPTTTAIAKTYPKLAPYVQNLAIQRGTPTGPDDDRQLEFYQPWDTDNPNPGKLTTELYNPKLQGQDLQDTVAGDMLHHLGTTDPATGQPVDPKWMAMKQQLIAAMGPGQNSMDQGAYQEEKSNPSYETAPYDQWMQNNRSDAYIRGALFPGQNPEWQEDGIYTPAMKEVTRKMKDYLIGKDSKRSGGSVSAAMDIARRVKRKDGGRVHVGPIIGDTGGRADDVFTADHCSALGEGNTLAGFKCLAKMFPKSAKAHEEDAKSGPINRATGGKVPIYAADGEWVAHPDDIRDRWGDLDRGHRALDEWQTLERQNHIHTLKNLDPPAQD